VVGPISDLVHPYNAIFTLRIHLDLKPTI
jgi:hypothetical protein